MRLLVLGGTVFLGRHVVEIALSRGHEVTLFHRGRHGRDLFPQVHRVLGDRDGGLSALGGWPWDAVVDTCGYVPRVVGQSVQFLAERCRLYVYISTVSVYADLTKPGADETAPLATLADPETEEINGETYGPLKAACDALVSREIGEKALIIRPGLIVGPWDPTDRFTYWPVRLAAGGEVLVPDETDAPVQFIDVRDLAEWTVTMCERGEPGIYNAVGPEGGYTFGKLIERCVTHAPPNTVVTPVSEHFLVTQGVQPWSDLPLWMSADDPYRGMEAVDGSRGWAAGLRTRDPEDTVADTLAWYRAEYDDRPLRAGMSRERERELLRLWHEQDGSPEA